MRTPSPRRSRRRCTSSPAIAIATAARDTAACSIASPANTARDATSASMRISTATSNPGKARPLRRFERVSSKASGSRWTSRSTNNRCPPSEPHALPRLSGRKISREALSQPGGVLDILLSLKGEDSYGVGCWSDLFGGFLPQRPSSGEDNEEASLLGYPPIGLLDQKSLREWNQEIKTRRAIYPRPKNAEALR